MLALLRILLRAVRYHMLTLFLRLLLRRTYVCLRDCVSCQFFDKFNIRHHINVLLKHLMLQDAHVRTMQKQAR